MILGIWLDQTSQYLQLAEISGTADVLLPLSGITMAIGSVDEIGNTYRAVQARQRYKVRSGEGRGRRTTFLQKAIGWTLASVSVA